MEKPSTIQIHFRDNPDLSSAFSGKEVGDRCPALELRDLVVAEKNEDSITLTYRKVAVEGYKPNPASKDGEMESGMDNSPVSMVLGAK